MTTAEIVKYKDHVEHIAVLTHKRSFNNNFDDTLADAWIGLEDALEKFKRDRSASFETYSSYRIEGSIIDGSRLRKKPVTAILGEQVDFENRKVKACEDKKALKHIEDIEISIDYQKILSAFKVLTETQKKLINLYYIDCKTSKEISNLTHKSQSCICHTIKNGIEKLRAELGVRI